MHAPEVHLLSKHFTNLIGREVKFRKATLVPDNAARWVYASYDCFSADDPTTSRLSLVKADLELLGALAGSLVGLPDEEVKRHLKCSPLEEVMRDSINEILNVASGVIASDCRVVLTGVAMNSNEVTGDVAQLMASPAFKAEFEVLVQGQDEGRFVVLG